jgi:hypothetical protein
MGAVVLLLAIIGFLVLLAYLKFPPSYANKKLVSTFDKMVLAVCTLMCVSWIFYMRGGLINTAEESLWEPLGVLGALGIEIVFLSICFVLRNFWVFKPPRRPGRDGFFGF